mgnify:CR=1 FL=1
MDKTGRAPGSVMEPELQEFHTGAAVHAYRTFGCHALPGADQFRKIGVDGMVREAGQFDVRGRAVGPARQRDAEYLAGLDRVLAERLVEVAHAEQQDRVAVHRLDAVVLLHQRRLDIFGFFCQVFKIIGSERKNSHLSSKKRSSKLIKYNFSVARVRAV